MIGEKIQQVISTRRTSARAGMHALSACILGLGLVVVVVFSVQAGRFHSSGQGGCGVFVDAVAQAEDDDTLTPMQAARASGGAIISKSLTIQGGWVPRTRAAARRIGSLKQKQTYWPRALRSMPLTCSPSWSTRAGLCCRSIRGSLR